MGYTNYVAETALNGAVNDSTTSWVVDDGSTYPDVPFTAECETELVRVTAKSGTLDVNWTVVRGWDDSTEAAHNDGKPVTDAVSARDFIHVDVKTNPPTIGDLLLFNGSDWMPYKTAEAAADTPPESPDAMDDEFDDASFDTGLWSILDTNGETITEPAGYGYVNVAYNANENRIRGIYQDAPATGDFEFQAKIHNPVGVDYSDRSYACLFVGASTTGQIRCVGTWGSDNPRPIYYSTPSSTASSWGTTRTWPANYCYYEVQWVASTTTLTVAISHNGDTYLDSGTVASLGWTQADMIVGLGWENNRNYLLNFRYGWFRRTA